jgi:SAM-dependent methyltransferase
VTRLGDTLAELEADARFDLIICSHVIEHVATTLTVIQNLSQHLSPGGYIFIEVPMEMLWHLPMQVEPVTHINFFTPHNLANLLTLAGLEVLDCRLMGCFHPSGKTNYGIRAVAQKTETTSQTIGLKTPDVSNYLRPNLLQKAQHILINPEILRRFSWRKVQRFFR